MAARTVDNSIFSSLGDRWYSANDDPVALLRAQTRLHAPWIASHVRGALGSGRHRVLDIGCGAGFLANALASHGLGVVGLDLADEALEVARRHQAADQVDWLRGDARALPLPDASFEVVCAMDVLEHVEPVSKVVDEVARVLVPGGLFFFHTFNRNVVSWLVVIKGVEWFVRNVPRDLHVLRAFIKPSELIAMCSASGLETRDVCGCAPRPSIAWLKLLATGIVPPETEFHFTRGTLTGYSGIAQKSWHTAV